MRLFDGLYLYEIVLLVLGILLFVVLLVELMILMSRGRSYKPTLPFFIMAAVMIAYPSIKSIQYKDGMLTIEKYLRTIQNNPGDLEARSHLVDAMKVTETRPARVAQTALVVAQAQYALGHEDAAEKSLQKAASLNPNDRNVMEFRERVEAVKRIDQLNSAVRNNPQDPGLRTQLQQQLATVTRKPITNPDALTKVAQAQASLGDNRAALENADKAVMINPRSTEAIRLRNEIRR